MSIRRLPLSWLALALKGASDLFTLWHIIQYFEMMKPGYPFHKIPPLAPTVGFFLILVSGFALTTPHLTRGAYS